MSDTSHARYLPEYALETAPRYTSYPPATAFTDAVGEADCAGALEALPSDAALSLYVHIPYCRALCWYCGCHTSIPTAADPLEPYLDALTREIELVARHVPSTARIAALHFGGGSPDSLSPAQLLDVMRALRSAFRFDPDAEIAAELDPRGATQPFIDALASQGLTRASLGVQTTSLAVQRRINRIQPASLVEATVRRLRSAGVPGVNLDLMYGLPGQTGEDVAACARFAAELGADRVAVFGYAHVPWFKKHQNSIKESELPDGPERFAQAQIAADTLVSAGYQALGFDHFALPSDALAIAAREGALRRNFQGYTTDAADALIGLGASSISRFPGLYVQNTPDTRAYRRSVAEGRLPSARGVALSAADREVGARIERLLCDFRAPLPERLTVQGRVRLERMRNDGLLTLHDGEVAMTPAGRPYVRNAAVAFEPDAAEKKGRHSLAV